MDHSSDASAVMADLRSLRRSSNERVVAGVCGGIARQLHIDPVLLRVLVVVLTFFGGVGAFLYAVAWLTLPVDAPAGQSVAEEALGNRSPRRLRAVVTAVVLSAAVVTIGVSGVLSGWSNTVLLVLAVLGLVALLNRERGQMTGPPPPAWMPPAPGGPPVGPWSTPPGTPYETYVSSPGTAGGGVLSAGATEPAARAGFPAEPIASPPPPDWVPPAWTAPLGDPYGPTGTSYDPGGTAAYNPPPPPPRSYLGILTISALVLVLGVLGSIDAAGADFSPVTYLFAALSVIGSGLIVGTWLGRSRGLIALGIIATIVYVPLAVLDGVTDGSWSQWRGAERVRQVPASVADIQSRYALDTGQIVLDLRRVDFSNTTVVSTSVAIGAGEIRVLVPKDVDLSIRGEVGLGELDLLDDELGGADRHLSISDLGADGAGSGHLVLDLSAKIGHVEVLREAA